MCGPKAPKDNSAEIAAQEEAARQKRIATGQASIDDAFAGFNDDFYNQYQNDYSGYYTPQLSDQYADSAKKLKLQLAQTGNLTGSVGANQLADLEEYYNNQQLAITGQSQDAVNQLRSNIDSSKSQLYADNRAAADPSNASAAAASAAASLQPSAPSSPLANVFSDFFSNLGNTAAISNAQGYSQGPGVQSYGGTGGGSSVYNVRS